MSTINGLNRIDPTKTSRGTKIMQSNGEMDKNSFLRILTAELSNQDPENAKDSTAYVTQMAQFSSIEQMANLNTNLTMSAANSMIGKGVVLKSKDAQGNPIVGIMKAAYKQGSSIKVGIETESNGAIETNIYSYDDIQGVTYNPSDNSSLNADLVNLLTQASLIGKHAEFNSKNANGDYYKGIVDGIVKNGSSYYLSVLLDGSLTNEKKDFSLADLMGVSAVR